MREKIDRLTQEQTEELIEGLLVSFRQAGFTHVDWPSAVAELAVTAAIDGYKLGRSVALSLTVEQALRGERPMSTVAAWTPLREGVRHAVQELNGSLGSR